MTDNNINITENENLNNEDGFTFSSYLRPNEDHFRNRIENILYLINRFNNHDYEENNNNNYYRRRMNEYPRNSYRNNTSYIDPSLIEELKNKKIRFNDNEYSYYHLCKLNLIYKNKYNILLNIDFTVKKILLKTKYIIYLNILDNEFICNNIECEKNFCNGKNHFGSKQRKLLIKIEDENTENLMEKLEKKIQDFKYCIECNNLWDIKKYNRISKEDYDVCDNCIIQNSLNKSTLIIIDKCSICLKNIYENNYTKTLCKHLFHKDCLETWLLKKNSCPLCRFRLKNTLQIIEEL
jgi:hypothetical protein